VRPWPRNSVGQRPEDEETYSLCGNRRIRVLATHRSLPAGSRVGVLLHKVPVNDRDNSVSETIQIRVSFVKGDVRRRAVFRAAGRSDRTRVLYNQRDSALNVG
jgi:hypothetical protein